jgi:hypothetical protein
MTEAKWLTESRHSQSMVWELRSMGKVSRTKAGKRKLRLFACGCCRLVWELLTDPRLQEAVEVAERFAEGSATKDELQAAFQSILELTSGGYNPDDPGVQARTAAHMALSATASTAMTCAFDMTALPVPLAGYSVGGTSSEATLCTFLRCVFGNPFRPMSVDRSWLNWNDGTIPRIAQIIYNERRFHDLPVLADALEEAGCTILDILSHCRQPGAHVRGCWVLDLVLGKG